jgi:regulator of protease activity HflC (stomatin/prohibitin superfamily)
MGKFNRILEPGLAILVPFLDRIAYVKSLKEAAIEIPSQSAITADNVTLELDGKSPLLPFTQSQKLIIFSRCTIYPCL